MNIIDPDDKKQLQCFYREWRSNYTERNPVNPPSLTSLRILFQYYTYGSIPGEFITAIIQNDLAATYSSCPLDEINLIYGTLQYVLVALPFEAYGSTDKFTKWIENKKKSKMFRPTDFY